MIADVATCLLAAAKDAWVDTARPAPPNAKVVVGATAYDECCEGMLIVSIDQLVWFDPFPVEQAGQTAAPGAFPSAVRPCRGTLGAYATIHVGLCGPVMNERGEAPTAQAEQEAGLDLLDLAETIGRTLACASEECWTIGSIAVGGLEGGCNVAQIQARIDGTCEPCP